LSPDVGGWGLSEGWPVCWAASQAGLLLEVVQLTPGWGRAVCAAGPGLARGVDAMVWG